MKFLEKEEVFKQICSASLQGTLGLFAGAGLTKALLEDQHEYQSYSWGELLKTCCAQMDVNLDVLERSKSYPELASMICKEHAVSKDVAIAESVALLKATIAKIITAYPPESVQKTFKEYFDKLNFEWIVTTNYDTMIEALLPGRAFPLTRGNSFIKINHLTPVYHMHGIKTDPDSIIITNEDYVSLFRPNDYWQSRLPFLMKESLVLMIGYAFGDINVITAVDWSKNVYNGAAAGCDLQTQIVQLLYTSNPKEKPYHDASGIIIFEIDDLNTLFDDLIAFFNNHKCEYDKKAKVVHEYIESFSSDDDYISEFINEKSFREKVIKEVDSLPPEFQYIYPSYISFLKRVNQILREKSSKSGAFEAYNEHLILLLDIIENMSKRHMPVAFFQLVADSLDLLAYHIGDSIGKAWSAYATWNERKNSIPKDFLVELNHYTAAKFGSSKLQKLIQDL